MRGRRLGRSAAIACMVAVACTSATAAVYRCGNAYADVPCPEATVIRADDRRSDADLAAAREVALREAALAARMVADRENAERLLLQPVRPARVRPPVRAASSAAARPLPKRRLHDRLRVDTDADFVAVVPRKR